VRFRRGGYEYEISVAEGGTTRSYLGTVDGRKVAEGADKAAVLSAMLIIGADGAAFSLERP
jgi:hypothetical protein